MAPDHVDGEKSTFRCLDAARYVVAAMVTVLIVTVIVYAIVLILRPENLTLVVVGGSMSVLHGQGPWLNFSFSLNAINLSGRARLYYTNITATFTVIDASGTDHDFIQIPFGNIVVPQQERLLSNALPHLNKTMMMMQDAMQDTSYVDMLSKNRSIPDAMLKLDGNLDVGLYSVSNQSSHMIYYCWPLTIGGDPSEKEDDTAADVECTENPPATS